MELPGHTDADRLFSASPALLGIAGMDGYFKRVNPAFEKTLGYPPEEFFSRPFIDFVHPEDRARTLAELDRLARGDSTAHFENRYRCKDGTYRWLLWTALPHADEGLIYTTALDVTEHKREEELFRCLFEIAPDALVLVGERGDITAVNAIAETLFGYSREEVIGRPVEIFVPQDRRASHRDLRNGYQANPRPRAMGSGIELQALRKDGSVFAAEISLGVLQTENETLTLAAVRDLTERKRTLESLEENRVRLLSAQRIQEHLLPKVPPTIPGVDIAASVLAAEFVGGDWFDYLPMPDGSMGLVIGDVSGHGLASALLMASSQTLLSALTQVHTDVGEILARANRFLCGQTEDYRFVTVFFGSLDVANRRLAYASAGHPTGYVFSASGAVKACLASTAPPLGMMSETAFPVTTAVTLESGDLLLLLTDGVLEAVAQDGSYFGVERVFDIVRENRERSARDIIERLIGAVRDFSGPGAVQDDVTALGVKVGANRPY